MNFTEEFKKLLLSTPRNGMVSFRNENCSYAAYTYDSKNLYLCESGTFLEDSYYCFCTNYSKNNIDCNYTYHSELCYESDHLDNCYNVNFSQDCQNCYDCSFCFECIGCNNCFGCVNLRRKSYYFFNQPLSKEKFEETMKQMDMKDKKTTERVWQRMSDLQKENPRVSIRAVNIEHSSGDYLKNCKNCYYCFDTFDSEDCTHCHRAFRNKDSGDISYIGDSELCYEVIGAGELYNCDFCVNCQNSSDLTFCVHCSGCKNCFGCSYLHQKEYHILNIPYSKEEYTQRAKQLREQLKKMKQYSFDLLAVGEP